MLGEFHRHAGDLLSFSQTIARYLEVRDNNFAFAPAYRGPDYLRVQLEKSLCHSTSTPWRRSGHGLPFTWCYGTRDGHLIDRQL